MADLSVDSGEVPLDMRLKSLISWKRVFIATIGVVAAVAIIGVALGAVGTGFGISAWNDVDSVEDDVDKLEDVVNRVKVPSPEDRFSNIPHGASAPLGAYDDDHDYAAGHLKATGHTSILPYYDGNSRPQGGSLSVMVEQRSYEGSFSYGHGTANCTNTERLLRVWGNSGPIVEGQNVGSNDGKATAGWKSYEQTLIADNTDYPESANFFAFGNHSAVFTYLSAAENLVQGIVSGTADDFDAMTVSTGPAGVAVYTNPSDCMFAGKQHQDQQHHLVARTAAPGVGAGGEVELCLVNSNAPYTVSCSAPAAFNAGEDIIIVDVNYIAGSETFLVTFVSGATGLQSIVVTVDRILLTTTLSAATIVDAAFVDQDCYKSDIVQSGTVFTYLYGGDGAIGLTAARYTLSGTTLTLVVAPAVLDASTTLVFDAASISASHFVVAVHDLATNILGELRLFSAVGTVSPSLEARLSYINNEGPVVTFRPVTLSSFGSDAILVGYSGVEWEYRPVAQIWHLHDAGTGYTLIPGEDKPMGRTVVDTTSCVPLATGERAICNFAPYASSLAGYSIKVSKLRSQQEASPLYARGLTNVFRSGHAPVGVALNDADAGDYVLVRQGGCMQTPSGVNQYANERKLCLHGDGTVTPNIHVSDANSMLWEPVCGLCRSTGASTYTCGYIVA